MFLTKFPRVAATVCCAFALCCCGGRPGGASKAGSQAVSKHAELSIPTPPAMMDDPQERARYVLENFWQNLSPQTDSIALEQAFANWCALTEYSSRKVAEKSLLSAYDKDPVRVLDIARRYLYDPNSPYRDEDFFGALASHIDTPEYRTIAELCSRGAVGTKAADFVFEDSRGRRHNLYDVRAPYTILFFSNPGCHACQEIIGQLSALGEAIDRGLVAVVNIYIDEDFEAWREYLPNYPANWLTGFDPLMVLRDGESYNIRAIPSVYLLGSDKTVILKDTPTERLLGYLQTHLQ